MLKINVPFSEKDIVKKLGGMWDPEFKTWYIPRKNYAKLDEFKKWLPFKPSDEVVILYAPIFLMKTTRVCWRCEKEIEIYGLGNKMINNSIYYHNCDVEQVDFDNYSNEDYYSKTFGFPIRFVTYITELPSEELSKIIEKSNTYKLKYSNTVKSKYYANTCPHCNNIQGDYQLYQELDDGFWINYIEKPVEKHVLNDKYDMILKGEIMEWLTI
ncbi:DUF5710 domain-containing protein [Fusibacter tunisiensis]|uniref:DUF5710 domain-containing protein n=1 Tax=Fusibacter tunisiensis TaxID=1008308 RepID=A0ABS2MUA9_9FIRM|nr:DUF5710 domain-containing protein [Fusibacter tunisiensis]MBM7562953.1 hypothetical protein [Fusibacter tunisiensis]